MAKEEAVQQPKYRIDIIVTINDVKVETENRHSSILRVPATLSVSVTAADLFEAISVLDKIKLLVQG